MTPDEQSFLIGAVLYIGAALFLMKAPKLWPKKQISSDWFIFWVILAAAYVIGVTWMCLGVFYDEVLTPIGHFLSDPTTWQWALGGVVIIIGLIIIVILAKRWWRENDPRR